MTDLTERLIALRDMVTRAPISLYPDEGATLADAANRLTELEDERNAIGDELVAARADNDRLVSENKRLREALEAAEELAETWTCDRSIPSAVQACGREILAALHPGVSEGQGGKCREDNRSSQPPLADSEPIPREAIEKEVEWLLGRAEYWSNLPDASLDRADAYRVAVERLSALLSDTEEGSDG